VKMDLILKSLNLMESNSILLLEKTKMLQVLEIVKLDKC